MPEGLTPFEIREALGSLARSRQTFLKVGLVGLGGTLVGFALLTIASHFRDRVSYQTKKKLKKVTVALQYLVAVVVKMCIRDRTACDNVSSTTATTKMLAFFT